MKRDFLTVTDFTSEEIRQNLDLAIEVKAKTKEGVLEELVAMLRLSPPASKTLLATLLTREYLGSTGVGSGIAIPHCRSLVVSRVRIAIGRSKAGIPFKSIDKKRAKVVGRKRLTRLLTSSLSIEYFKTEGVNTESDVASRRVDRELFRIIPSLRWRLTLQRFMPTYLERRRIFIWLMAM